MPKAIQIEEYGDPSVLKLVEVALPPLQPTEVRFRVIAAAVNRADIEIRSGKWQILAAPPFPYTPGLEALGEVMEVGQAVQEVKVGDQSHAFAEGDRVMTMMQKLGGIHGIRPGGYQEFVTVEANTLAIVPPELNPLEVAALGLAAVTAYNGIKRLHLMPSDRIVVHGATGGVGSVAVSMAKAMGARVIATTSSSSKDDYLHHLGADEIVHLHEQRLIDSVQPRSVDAVFETIGEQTFADSVAVLKRGGYLCLVGAVSGENLCFTAWDLLQDLHLTGYSSENLTGDDLRSDMAQICQWLTTGQVSAPPYQSFSLAEAARVHALLERRKLTGRVLLIQDVL